MKTLAIKILIFAGILISINASAANNAKFITQSVPHTMETGIGYTVSVTVKNTGTTSWTPEAGYKLGSRFPTDNGNWSLGRVTLGAGETIAPGQIKTFSFNVVGPVLRVPVGKLDSYDFQWGMLQEGVEWFGESAPIVNVDVFAAPGVSATTFAVDPAFNLFPRSGAPVAVSATVFNNSFRGANVLQQTYEDERACDHKAWIPDATQIEAIAKKAVDMGLSYLRMPVIIPPTVPGNSLGPQYCDSVHLEWYSTDNSVNMGQVLSKVQTVLDTASAHGLKVVLVIDGYTKYDTQCYWKRSYLDIQANATTIVQTFKSHPALLAWDLLNEPLWNAGVYDCLSTSADYASVVNAVHAMYNLVREKDTNNHPTTVGEAQNPYFKYWRDISSYASPHLYLTPHQKNENSPYKKEVKIDQINYVQGAALREMERSFGTMPIVIGEFGLSTFAGTTEADPIDETTKDAYYERYLNGLTVANRGHMLWSLSTSSLTSQQSISLLNANATLKPAAETVARQIWYPIVQQLYNAYLGRPADPGALKEFSRQLLEVARLTSYQDGSPNGVRMANTLAAIDAIYNSNAQTRTLIDSLGASAESRALYDYSNTSALVSGIYMKAFKRAPDSAGLQYWVAEIDSGRVDKNRAALSIIAGASTNTTSQGLIDAATMQKKGAVAANFAASLNTAAWVSCYSGASATATGRSLLDPVTSTTDVKAYQATIDLTLRNMATGLSQTQQTEGRPICQ